MFDQTHFMFKKPKHILVLAFSVGVLLFVFSTISSRKPKNIAAFDRPIIVDHTSIELFDQIPDEYLQRARDLHVLFSDRSVGQNINEALNCFTAATWAQAPASCRRDYYDTNNWLWKTYNQTDLNNGVVPPRLQFTPDPVKYNRDNWIFEFKAGSWSELTQDFVQVLAPAYVNDSDVLTYQFSYLNVDQDSDIADPNVGFFADNPDKYDIYDLEDYISQHPTKTFVFWTSSLARTIGTTQAQDFNQQMRQYAIDNNKVLLDMADITSHTDTGVPCYDTRDGSQYCTNNNRCENLPDDGVSLPAICQDYTTETEGGHLGSVSVGKVLMAKAFWVMMAQIAGWDPNGGQTTTATPTPSASPTGIITSTPTPTPIVNNDPPVVNNSSYQTSVDTPVAVSLSYTDPDGPGPYTVTISALPQHGSISGSGTNYTYTPASGYTGTDTFQWQVSDGDLTSTAIVTITISNSTPGGVVSYYWSFDTNTTTPDVGTCTTCANSGAVWTSNGYSSGAFDFTSPTGGLKLGTLDWGSTNEFTITAWVKPHFDETDGSWHYIFSQSNSINVFYLSNLNDFRVMLRTANGNFRADTNGLTWNPETWHHVMLTYNGNLMRFYWDGSEVASTPASGALLTNVNDMSVGLSIANNGNFNGVIDEVEVYPSALTPAQVLGISTTYVEPQETFLQKVLHRLGL